MIYIDTSALVPIFIHEAKSEAVVAWLESAGERLALSEWSLVEFASAAAIKVRAAEIAANLAKRATAEVQDFARKHCTIAVPGREEFHRAAEMIALKDMKLRAGDALHLAIALKLKVRSILCLDNEMVESAKALGMSAVSI